MLPRMSRAISLLLVIVACAGPTKPAPQTVASRSGSGSNMVCHEVTDTGSMFSHTECVPADDKQAQTDDADRWLKQPRSEPIKGH
jgi:hypothetical protein